MSLYPLRITKLHQLVLSANTCCYLETKWRDWKLVSWRNSSNMRQTHLVYILYLGEKKNWH